MSVFLMFLLHAAVSIAGPVEVITAADADLDAAMQPDDWHDVRYMTDFHVPEKKRGSLENLLRFHVNSLSREAELVNPTLVAPSVYRVLLSDYGWDAEVWERLRDAPEPYFHAVVETAVRPVKVLNKTLRTKSVRSGEGKKRIAVKVGEGKVATRKRVVVSVPEGAREAMARLIERTGSEVPIVRADWFWLQTAVQEQRVAGYYDFLKLKNRTDYEELIGLNVAVAKNRRKEVYTIVPESGVAHLNRQIVRYGAVDSSSWRTLDVFDTETGRRNAINNLGKDFKHDAEEHYGFLPNGLFAYYLSDANGTAQNTAPDKIGPDKTSTSNDGRIHAYVSCVRCHREGLRPIKDVARRLFVPPVGLAFVDRERFRLEKARYLQEYQRSLLKDQQEFAYHLAKVTGWTPPQLSDAVKDWWDWANDQPVTLDRAADELGVKKDQLRATLLRHAMPHPVGTGSLPPVLASFVQEPAGSLRREHWDEHFQKVQAILVGGVQP